MLNNQEKQLYEFNKIQPGETLKCFQPPGPGMQPVLQLLVCTEVTQPLGHPLVALLTLLQQHHDIISFFVVHCGEVSSKIYRSK
jgi:hypothetical protein